MRRNSAYKGENQPKAPRGRKVTVKEQGTLLPFLFQLLNEQSKSSVKMMLSKGQISVNGKVTSQFNTPLEPNDIVNISYERGKVAFNNPLLKIVWEDDSLIVVNKKEGLLSVSTTRVKERTAFHILSDYVKKSDPRNKIFILHRLDRETSGLMMFAKNRKVQETLQSNWNNMITQRSYVAVVEGRPERDTDLITSFLTENAQMQVYVTAEGNGKEAITRYRVLQSNEAYSLVDLELETGRKNQIRAQMQSIGHPIAGDYKYGADTDPAGRLMLHARKLYFIHPETGEEMCFETRTPDAFISLAK
ncbi:RluA family pseudouridine synthase [Parabacteroides bouchesdurhonensis]|uniref:RluA family pseudouridine synthase n=1 Tax=Parabacteroides bouchesdurhonensis TaxID=1936995 RepID=UPI000C84D1EE|nr:RluA family pseudouridine synthase [Parabacteroides bouchesdurhonensis]